MPTRDLLTFSMLVALGGWSQALDSTLKTLRQRIAGFEAQAALAASTDFPVGE